MTALKRWNGTIWEPVGAVVPAGLTAADIGAGTFPAGQFAFRDLVQTNNAGGRVGLEPGDSIVSGRITFSTSLGRQGYIGRTSSTSFTDTGTIPYVAGVHAFTGDVSISGSLSLPLTTSYVPVLSAVTTNPVLGTGSVATAQYQIQGNFLDYTGKIKFGTSGATFGSGNYRISLPVAVAQHDGPYGWAKIVDASAGTQMLMVLYYVDSTHVALYGTSTTALAALTGASPTVPMTWAASDEINFTIRCRV